MIMLSKFLNFPDELSENDEFREYELSGSDCSFLCGAQVMRAHAIFSEKSRPQSVWIPAFMCSISCRTYCIVCVQQ